MSFIVFDQVTREYSSGKETIKALDNASFNIEKGSFVVILGASGSGKSTTLNLVGGMDKATSGNITVDNNEITSFNDKQLTNYRRHDIGFVFQFYNLIPNLTAYENVDVACRLGRNPFSTKVMLDSVGLSHRTDNFPAELSGGELQRLSIARALCKNPKLLLCDEPTGALDSETGKMILELLQQISREYDNTVLIVTHNSSIASVADMIVKLKDGSVVGIQHNSDPLPVRAVEW